MMDEALTLDRRDFLKLGSAAGGGLLLGVYAWAQSESTGVPFRPNAFVQIDSQGTVSIWVHKSEMGQGVRTTLPMIVADELDADWNRVNWVQADADADKYGRQRTVGSRSVRGGAWLPLRRAGAAAREMLVSAAAARWKVDPSACRTDSGRVIHADSDRALTYGQLAEDAARIPIPKEPRLKNPSEFRLIGKPIPQVDTLDKVIGKTTFGIDVRLPGMLYATVLRCPVFGGSMKSFDAGRAKQISGVRDVFTTSQGLAIVAENTWSAFQGAKAAEVTWDEGGFSMGNDDIFRHFAKLSEREGAVARDDGDVGAGLKNAARRLEAIYRVPYLAHATMEPMNCTAHVQSDRCEIWAPTQSPQSAQSTAARVTGLPADKVTVHVTAIGCGLGRRSRSDFVRDAVETSRKIGGPVQVVWTREEDIQHDYYRPATYNRLEGGLDERGRVTALRLRIVASPIVGSRRRPGGEGVNRASVDGAANLPYGIPNLFVDYIDPELPVPVGHWRSVGPSQNTFIVESFIDELAHAAGVDPIEFRMRMLEGNPRLRRVLQLAAEKSGWREPPADGRARGVALVENKGGHVAQVAEVSWVEGGARVHRVTCVVDCGQIINPDIVEAQTVGSIVHGLSAALHGEITLQAGRVSQSNFHDYTLLRIGEMPRVDVHLVASTEEPGGAGEPAVPPIAPAVTNALFALTGTRYRRLPIA